MRSLLRTLLRVMVSAILLFFAIALIQSLVQFSWGFDRDRLIMPLALGFGGGLLFFVLVSRFLILYVFGHELTHWAAAKVFFRRTGAFRISRAKGSVAIDRPNIWIVLAPYFVPVYSLLLLGAYGITDFFWHPQPDWFVLMITAMVGVTYAFHVRLTVYALRREQSDVLKHGYMLSMSTIAFCNVLILYLCCMMATRQWSGPAVSVAEKVEGNAGMIAQSLRVAWLWGERLVAAVWN